jgi:transcription initiation factor IIE alpha subunit
MSARSPASGSRLKTLRPTSYRGLNIIAEKVEADKSGNQQGQMIEALKNKMNKLESQNNYIIELVMEMKVKLDNGNI